MIKIYKRLKLYCLSLLKIAHFSM